jgi:hypothetical protein
MKKALVLAVVAIAGIVAWRAGLLETEAAPATAYRAHRQRYQEARGFTQELIAQAKWSMEIDRCEQSGSSARVLATEETAQIPRNAASFAFATIVTRQLEAELALRDGDWVVVREEVLREDVSTYEDRKNARP